MGEKRAANRAVHLTRATGLPPHGRTSKASTITQGLADVVAGFARPVTSIVN